MKVIKRNGNLENFDETKIMDAILKAIQNTGENTTGLGAVLVDIKKEIQGSEDMLPSVYSIENTVFNKLVEHGWVETAKSYEGYRAVQEHKRLSNTTDDSIMELVNRTNVEVMEENSNKNATVASTQRDLIAGEVSKDIARRKLLPAHIVQAHDNGAIHYHDLDYAIQNIFNCCLINLEDMLGNGTVINEKLVEPPKSFGTACTVITQIIAQVASNQYGGNSITIRHIAPYLRVSYEKYLEYYTGKVPAKMANELATGRMMEELKAGIQTIRYQLSTLQTTNGRIGYLC